MKTYRLYRAIMVWDESREEALSCWLEAYDKNHATALAENWYHWQPSTMQAACELIVEPKPYIAKVEGEG